MRLLKISILLAAAFALSAAQSNAQVIFSSELDSDAGWTIVADSDTSYEFGFDYSTFGIPANPYSTSGDTTGLKMAANLADGVAAAIAATPDGVSVSGSYTLSADFWLNYNTSGGTTEYIGGFVGYDAGGSPINGAGILGDSDGDSGSDYRIYSGGSQIAARNNSEAEISAAFPGQEVPAAQGDAALFDPTNTIVTAPDGTLGFGWHTLEIVVDGGIATTTITDATGTPFEFGMIDSSADPSALDGGVALVFADLFSSVSTKPEFSFGVFDNVTVTQVPEPNAQLLAIFGLLGVAGFRRRK